MSRQALPWVFKAEAVKTVRADPGPVATLCNAASGRSVTVPTGIFIKNEFRTSIRGKRYLVKSPVAGKTMPLVQFAQAADAIEAIGAAREARQRGSKWSSMGPAARGKLLNTLADLMERDKEDIIEIEMLDTGKTRRQVSTIDFPASVGTLRYFAGWADKMDDLASADTADACIRREPIGVCSHILHWTYPLLGFVWNIAPTLMAGNTTVVNSSGNTPLSALRMCQLSQEAGFPDGVINHVQSPGENVVHQLTCNSEVDLTTYNRISGPSGGLQYFFRDAKEGNRKKTVLELWDKRSDIIFPDADIYQLIGRGPSWGTGSRIYVHEDVYDEFVEGFIERMSRIKVGDNFDPGVDLGPVTDAEEYERLMDRFAYVQAANRLGHAKVSLGGRASPLPIGLELQGYYIEPTIVELGRNYDAEILTKKFLGPFFPVVKFSDNDNIVRRVWENTYGHAMTVHTQDPERLAEAEILLRKGGNWFSLLNFLQYGIPFGGGQGSDFDSGQEFGAAVLQKYTETKPVFKNLGVPLF